MTGTAKGLLAATIVALAGSHGADGGAGEGVNWPSFRGPRASGVAEGYRTPATWDVESAKNVRWITPIPGLGHSSPVVWGDRVFVTSSVGAGDAGLKVGLYGAIASVKDDPVQSWKVYCLDKKTGKVLWERAARAGAPKVKRHPKSSHANPTPATDGKRVVAFFGSEGLYCYDLEGTLRWKKDLGVLDAGFFMAPEAQWGFGSSPVIHDDLVVVQCDVLDRGFLAAFDADDGREVWRTPRHDVPTWSTPTVYDAGGATRIAVNGHRHIGGYDLRTGRELWKLRGGGDIPVPTPVVAHGLIYFTSAHGRPAPIYAVRASAKGDVSLRDEATSNAHVAWSRPRSGAYMQTPLVYRDHLYVCRDNGVLTVYGAKSGEKLGERRLGKGTTGFTASMVAADGKLYVTSEMGDVHVIGAGPELEVLATSALGEICMSTPAISEGMLIFRTRSRVLAIAAKDVSGPSREERKLRRRHDG